MTIFFFVIAKIALKTLDLLAKRMYYDNRDLQRETRGENEKRSYNVRHCKEV